MSSLADRAQRLPPSTRRLFNRFWAVAGAVSVRTKILGIVLALVLILGAGVTLQVRLTLRDSLSHDLQHQGISIARDVAARSVDLLLVRDLYAVHQLLRDTLSNNEDVSYAFIVSPQGEILAHTFGDRFPTALIEANSVTPTQRYQLQKMETNEGVIWDFAVPIFDGQAGIVRVGLSEEAMQATLSGVTGQLLLTTIGVSIVGMAAAIFLTWLITRPVLTLVDVTKSVARGDLSRQAPHWADDEIGLLSDSFNAMTKDLAATQTKSEAYNAELIRRNRELAALNLVAQTVSQRQDLHDMLENALRCVLDLMRMQAGWIVLLDEASGGKRQLACSMGLPQAIAHKEAEQDYLNCQCGRVADEKTTLLITPLKETCPVYQLKLGNQQIVNGHVAVPLISKSQVLGTLNIPCSRHNDFSGEDLQLLSAIGQQLGVAVDNARLWREIRRKEEARSRLLAQLINAQEEERQRIARELHDGVGQDLTSLIVGLKLLNQLDDPETLAAKSEELRRVAGETLDEVRLLSRQLRPSVLDDLGLAAALERYTVEFSSHYPTLAVDLHCNLPQRLPLPLETTIYRIVQEAMTNTARHSQANTLSVLLSSRNGRVQAIVEDDGIGFDPETARRAGDSVGLHSMAERADLLGGDLKIESSTEGTAVYVEVPV